MGKQLQFELWQECNNLCKFCYLGRENRKTPDELKKTAIRSAIEKISDLNNYPEYDTIGLIGGEFFQGQLSNPEVKNLFFELIDKINWLQENLYIKHIWICATLTIGDQKDLYDTIDRIKNKDSIWICTSYDTKGRFHTTSHEENWKFHMKKIHETYPEILFNVTTILTQDCIEKYLSNELSFKDMMSVYNCKFFFKQCGAGACGNKQQMNAVLPWFFPKRSTFLEFLNKFHEEESEDMWSKLFNIVYRADTLYRNFNSEDKQMQLNARDKYHKQEITDSDNVLDCMVNPKCGHPISYQAYIDSDACVLCDKHMIEGI